MAECVKRDGRRDIKIDGATYQAHRLAILHATGEWPAGDVRHKNRRKDDNRPSNLK